jgi:thiamine biosynthesis protein ThiS
MAKQKIVVFANGRARQVSPDLSILDLMSSLKVNPKAVLVEINGTALFREEWVSRELEHGDRLEIIRVVAGG